MTKIIQTLKNIQQRQTVKVLSDKACPVRPYDESLVETIIEAAYWAPFHRPCDKRYLDENENGLNAVMPWRFYVLNCQECRKLAALLNEQGINMGKVEGMLNSADFLIQTTWLPDYETAESEDDKVLFKGTIENMEHIASAGAAVQNMLVTTTEMGLQNYWSSGGVLRDDKVFELLGIGKREILIGSVFIFPGASNESEQKSGDNHTDFIYSKMRSKRGDLKQVYKRVQL